MGQAKLMTWLVYGLFCVLATVLLTVSVDTLPTFVREGDIAQKDIKADRNYEIVDQRSTENLREEALAKVLPVYDWDLQIGSDIRERLAQVFNSARQAIEEKRGAAETKKMLEEEYSFVFDETAFQILVEHQFNWELCEALIQILEEPFQKPLAIGKETLEFELPSKIMVRYLNEALVEREEVWDNLDRIVGVDSVKQAFLAKAPDHLVRVRPVSTRLFLEEAQELSAWVGDFIIPTTQFNRQETELRKQKIVAAIKDVIVKIKVGEVIIRAGDRFDAWQLAVIDGIRNENIETNRILQFVGTLLLFAILTLSVYWFSKRYIKKFKLTPTDLYFLEFSLLLSLLLTRFGAWFSAAAQDTMPVVVDVNDLYYAIPLAGMVMVVRMVLNAEISMIFAVVVSLMGGLYLGGSLELAMYYVVSSLLAAHGVASADKRLSIIKAGAIAGVGNMAVIVCVQMITVFSVDPTVDWLALFLLISLAFASGPLSAVLAMSVAPIVEMIFHYTTSIKLLELANLDHPLLRKMVLCAPGTYHHSHLVGMLAEAGARSIDANALLARVSSYYHDIGKMNRPLYFIENQTDKLNRHDRLRPSVSASVIADHVRDGLEMAKKYQLPPCIVDMIPQHQGTKVMSYFYEKAKAQAMVGECVNEAEYRYPGPKPQSREAGIIMLSDATEAAVRSMPEKTQESIDAMVKKLMNRHFSDGQFDECELTLKDLHLIAESFVAVLLGIYHNRIEYPDIPEEKPQEVIFAFKEITVK